MNLPKNINQERLITPSEIAAVAADGAQDAVYLAKMRAEAEKYILSFDWCQGLADVRFGGGIGKIVAAFLVQLVETRPPTVDEWLWVVVGDTPSAFLVADGAPDGAAAIRVYCDLMQDWVDAVRQKRKMSEVFPVKAPADQKHADLLATRLVLLRDEIIPQIELQLLEMERRHRADRP
jgi:hypothetical protein